MKKMFRIITLIMAFVLLISVTACGKNKNREPDNQTKITETDNYLVKDGKSDYVIVYPHDAETTHIQTSIDELQLFFYEATGITLPVKADNDDSVVWSYSAKYISLGETYLLRASGAGKGIDRKELNITGYVITNKGDSVFLIGGRENGVINAVYRFLFEQFNFVCYSDDEIVLDNNVQNEFLLNYQNVKVIPDIAFHGAAQGAVALNQIYSRRIGMVQQADWLVELGGQFFHNWTLVVPVDKYYNDHPDWFTSADPKQAQLCLTKDKEGLAEVVLQEIIKVLQDNPAGYAIGFTQMDDLGWCECPSCNRHEEKYGSNSASQILFMNYLWDLLEDWLEINMPEREVYLYMFAYQANTEPPLADANGNIPEEMKLNEHIYVQIAPIYAGGYKSYGYKNPDGWDNESYDTTFKGWKKVTDNLMVWTYSFYYKANNGIYPYFDFSDMQETFKYVADCGADFLFDEDHISTKTMSDWSRLKIYLRSKLAWDTDADLSKETDAFFTNYYKAAAVTMRALFDSYSTYFAMLIEEYQLRGQGGAIDILEPSMWPKGVMDGWMRLFDQAYADIEHIKETDPELHTKLYDRIRLDSVSLRYLCMYLHDNYCIYQGDGNTIDQDLEYFGLPYSKLLK